MALNMLNFFRKNLKVSLPLVWFLGFLFFLFPFYHYHPENLHGHLGELLPHQHSGHFHSPELEGLEHLLAFQSHPYAENSDRDHSHSPSDKDSHKDQVNLHKTKLKYGPPFKLKKKADFADAMKVSRPSLLGWFSMQPVPAKSTAPVKIPTERSPPVLFL